MTDPARPARSTSDTLFMPKAKPSGLRDSRGGWTLSPDLREQVTRRLRLIALMYSLAFFFLRKHPSVRSHDYPEVH